MNWLNIISMLLIDDQFRLFQIFIIISFIASLILFYIKRRFKNKIDLTPLYLSSVAMTFLLGIFTAALVQFVKFYDLPTAIPISQHATEITILNNISFHSLLMSFTFIFFQVLLHWGEQSFFHEKGNDD